MSPTLITACARTWAEHKLERESHTAWGGYDEIVYVPATVMPALRLNLLARR